MGSARLAREYISISSENSLKSMELAQCNSIAELRRQLLRVVDEWIQAEVEFRVVQGILGNRQNDGPSGTRELSNLQSRQPLGPHNADRFESFSSSPEWKASSAASEPPNYARSIPGLHPHNLRDTTGLNSRVDQIRSRHLGSTCPPAKLASAETRPRDRHHSQNKGACVWPFARKFAANTSLPTPSRMECRQTRDRHSPVQLHRIAQVRKLGRV